MISREELAHLQQAVRVLSQEVIDLTAFGLSPGILQRQASHLMLATAIVQAMTLQAQEAIQQESQAR
jgi:hypothetical protein